MTALLLSLALAATTLPPVLSAPTGHYTGPLTVTVTAPTYGSTVYCTYDGTEPATTSVRYVAPVTLRYTTMMKCRSWVSGKTRSTVTTALYHITDGFQISPAAPVVAPATTVKFTTVPAIAGVTWSADGGAMYSDGTWVSPPCSSPVTQVTISARIVCDDVRAAALVQDKVTGIEISPPTVTLKPGQTQQFTAKVQTACFPLGVIETVQMFLPPNGGDPQAVLMPRG